MKALQQCRYVKGCQHIQRETQMETYAPQTLDFVGRAQHQSMEEARFL